MSRPAPICASCAQEMRCKKNDFPVKDKASGSFPSTVWLGDLFKCPSCGTEIVVGFGKGQPGPEADPRDLAFAQEFSR